MKDLKQRTNRLGIFVVGLLLVCLPHLAGAQDMRTDYQQLDVKRAELAKKAAQELKAAQAEASVVPKKKKKDFLDQKIEQERKRRLFLHTLSVLQREGRLLDFFAEDLNQYEDDQIGAAARSIQDDCKKAVKKYINPVPVIDKEEGDTVTIEPGFDMDAVALVGNVTGEPPFEGVLRHPGWKAAKKELPKLSDIQDPGIMVPAEVEIQ